MKLKRGRISVSFTLGYCKKIIFVRVRFFEVVDLSLDLKELRSQFKIIKKYLYISWGNPGILSVMKSLLRDSIFRIV